MVFQMSLKAMIEEELIEARAIQEMTHERIGKVVDLIRASDALDHKNDKIRMDIRQLLLGALMAYDKCDYPTMHKNIHAALQRLQDQEQLDLEDDLPKVEAVLELSKLQAFSEKCSARIRGFLGKLNQTKEKKSDG